MPVTIRHTCCALQRMLGYSADNPGTRTSCLSSRRSIQFCASGANMVISITFGRIGVSAAQAVEASRVPQARATDRERRVIAFIQPPCLSELITDTGVVTPAIGARAEFAVAEVQHAADRKST